MKEINIANVIVKKRKEKGITQDDLAKYIGVSKASVSKWETGQSFPDVTFLPQLATYFNISIDELMGYFPQMTKEDIKDLYVRLSSDFVSRPFDEVLKECESIIKKYYSCFPLLLQMAILLINHHMLAPDKAQQYEILEEVIRLFERIRVESNDIRLSKSTLVLEAGCYQMMGKPEVTLNLLGEAIYPMQQDIELIAQAYQQMGNIQKAKETIGFAMYQHLLFLIGDACQFIVLNADNVPKIDIILERAIGVANLFEVNSLNPNSMAMLYLTSAQVYCGAGHTEKAIEMLEQYVKVCIQDFFPYTLHGDSFFDTLEEWFEDFDLGNAPPRNEEIIKKSIIETVENNPAFLTISDDPRYRDIIEKLKTSLGG